MQPQIVESHSQKQFQRRLLCVALLMVFLFQWSSFIEAKLSLGDDEISHLGRGTITSTFWRSDGKAFIVNGNQGARIYTSDFEETAFLKDVQLATFSPDSRQIASVDQDHTHIMVWDITRSTPAKTYSTPVHIGRLFSLRWHPDGGLLAAGSESGAFIFDGVSGQLIQSFDTLPMVRSISWSPDESTLAVVGEQRVNLYDATNFRLTLTLDDVGRLPLVAWKPDGQEIATGFGDATESYQSQNAVKVWNSSTGELVTVIQAGVVDALVWSPDGKVLATSSRDFIGYNIYPVRFWNPATGELLQSLQDVHRGRVHSIAWNADSTQLMTASDDNTLRLWDWPLDSTQTNSLLQGHMGEITSIAWSPDQAKIATGSRDGGIRVWDALSGNPILTLQVYAQDIWSVDWSADGTRLASSSSEYGVRIWDVSSGEEIVTLSGHERTVSPGVGNPDGVAVVEWSPDDSLLATGGYDGTTRIWESSTGYLLNTLRGYGLPALSTSWHPDGHRLMSADGSLQSWDVKTGQVLDTYQCNVPIVISAALSPDGSKVAGTDKNIGVCIWDVATQQLLNTFYEHVDSLVWHPDGELLAGVLKKNDGSRQQVIIWNVENDENTLILEQNTVNINALAFSPDGTLLASGGVDGTVRLWGVQEG